MNQIEKQSKNPPGDPVLLGSIHLWKKTEKIHVIPIKGDSMLPILRAGDKVAIQFGTTDINMGDLVVFQIEQSLVTHRLIQIKSEGKELYYLTKGDNSLFPDPPVDADQILGKVIQIHQGDKIIDINLWGWKSLGTVIALSSLVWIKIFESGKIVKTLLLGTGPNRYTRLIRNWLNTILRAPIRIIKWLMPGSTSGE